MENLDADIFRQDLAKELTGRLLVNVVHLRRADFGSGLVDRVRVDRANSHTGGLGRFESAFALLFFRFFGHADIDHPDFLDGQEVLGDQALRNDRFEFVEENVDAVDFSARVTSDDTGRQSRGETVFDLAKNADVLADDLHAAGPG